MNTYQAIGAILALLVLAGGVGLTLAYGRDALEIVAGLILAVFGAVLTAMLWPLAVLVGGVAGARFYLLRREAR